MRGRLITATPSAIAYGTALSSTQLDATASVPGTIVYTPAAGTILTAGSQTLSAAFTPTDTVNNAPATATVVLAVNPVTPTLSWTAPAGITYGTPLSAAQLNATATFNGAPVPGTFVYSPAAGTTLDVAYTLAGTVGTSTLTVAFTPTDTVDYQPVPVNGSVSLTVSPATQTISFPTVAFATVGVASTLSATASSGLTPVTFALVSGNATLNGSSLTLIDAKGAVVSATQAGNGDYLPVTVRQTVTPGAQASQTISFSAIDQHFTNDQPFPLSASASSGLMVTFTILDNGPATISGSNVVLGGAAGTVVVQASQGGDGTYAAAPSVTQSFKVVTPVYAVYLGSTGGTVVTSDDGTRTTLAANVAASLSADSGYQLQAVATSDNIAATISPDGRSGTLVGFLPSLNQGFVIPISPDALGHFTATGATLGGTSASTDLTITGTIVGSALSGTIAPLGFTFGATADPVTGPTSTLSGLYQSSNIGSSTGSTYSIVGTQGEVFVLAVSPTAVASGSGSVNAATGAFSVTTAQATTVAGSLDAAANTVSGTVTTSTGTVSFSGHSDVVNSSDVLVDMSALGYTVPGNPLIAGFVINGTVPKTVIVRGVGPALTGFGVANAEANPQLALYDGSSNLLATNAGWGGSASLAAAFAQVCAFPFAAGSADAALETTLSPGLYTIVISAGPTDSGGAAMAEIYDASIDPSEVTQRLVDISSKGQVSPGNPLTGGFVISGNAPKKVLIRAVGPALAGFGVAGALADPVLTVFDSTHTVVAMNDDWGTPLPAVTGQTPASAADIVAAEESVGAFPLTAGSADSAVIVVLAPGLYSGVISSAGNGSGAALIEVYEIAP